MWTSDIQGIMYKYFGNHRRKAIEGNEGGEFTKRKRVSISKIGREIGWTFGTAK